MKTGIKETKELLGFVLALVEAGANSLADGRIGFTDAIHFFEAFRKLSDAVEDIHKVLDEAKDYDEAEKAELKQYIKDEFDIPGDMVEEYIEKGLALGIDLLYFITMFLRKKK